VAVGVKPAARLVDEEDADERDKEHQVAAQRKEQPNPRLR
jgi:hypothetical protein